MNKKYETTQEVNLLEKLIAEILDCHYQSEVYIPDLKGSDRVWEKGFRDAMKYLINKFNLLEGNIS